jgi:hypothetical protein
LASNVSMTATRHSTSAIIVRHMGSNQSMHNKIIPAIQSSATWHLLSHVRDTGYGAIIGFIEHLKLVTINNHNSLNDLQTVDCCNHVTQKVFTLFTSRYLLVTANSATTHRLNCCPAESDTLLA